MVVAIILVIAAFAIPNLLRSRMSANEASAVSSIRTINAAMINYTASYPTVGFAGGLSVLGSTPCHPNAATPCLIDGVLAGGAKSGYNFAVTASSGPPAYGYYVTAVPMNPNQTGINSFCSSEDAVIHADSTGALPRSEAACKALSPQGSGGGGGSGSGGGGSGSGGSGGGGGGNGNGNNGNGNGNGGGNGSNGGGNGNGNNGSGNGDGGSN